MIKIDAYLIPVLTQCCQSLLNIFSNSDTKFPEFLRFSRSTDLYLQKENLEKGKKHNTENQKKFSSQMNKQIEALLP